jgi:hypothetical protein
MIRDDSALLVCASVLHLNLLFVVALHVCSSLVYRTSILYALLCPEHWLFSQVVGPTTPPITSRLLTQLHKFNT